MDAGIGLVHYLYFYKMVQQETSKMELFITGGKSQNYHLRQRFANDDFMYNVVKRRMLESRKKENFMYGLIRGGRNLHT